MIDRRSELSNYKDAITSLARRVLEVDVRAYESMPPERLASELQPIVSELLASANTLVSDVLRTYEAASVPEPRAEESTALASPYVPFEQAIDAAIGAQSASSLQAVGDIAFLAHLELRQRAERLDRVTACKNAMAIVSESDSALRRIRKALTSIDVAMARAGLAAPSLDFASELEVSLRVRRACAKLRSRVFAGGSEPTPESLHPRLRSAGTAIAMLVGWDVYPSLRVRDRLQLRDLQRRILEWLRSERDLVEGMRLWQDLIGFIGMLSQVNRRQELVEHDTRAVLDAHARVVSCEAAELPPNALAVIASLEGLDEELDALLASRRTEPAAFRAPLERLARLLRPSRGAE